MEISLTPIEARILGALIEKQMSTPDYYPLTLNTLISACNQKTNREPVMALDEAAVIRGLDSLRSRRLVWQVKTQNSRTPKYEHNMQAVAEFSSSELGILCELLLRGPQTAGELRARSARLVEFGGLAAVDHSLQKLIAHEKGPFVVELPRRPGHKENRFGHLFCTLGPPGDASEAPVADAPEDGAAAAADRIAALEKAVDGLQQALEDLRGQFLEFKQKFE
ncbi:MAG: YceH family protein [Desulfobacterales bacterium]|jgi:uncharacterized protein YceH (UPF0502 family)|nr:YceH family protein [Desulfobacterales bacterium]